MEVEHLVARLEMTGLGAYRMAAGQADAVTAQLRGNMAGLHTATGAYSVSTGKASSATREFSTVSSNAAGAHERHAKALGGLEREARGGISSFTGLGRAMTFASNAFLGGFVVGGALKAIVDATRNQQEATDRLRRSVENAGMSWQAYGGQIEGVIKKQSQLSLFTKTDVADGLNRLVVATGNVATAEAGLGVATNLARATHEDLATAVRQVAMAETGRLTTIRGLQISIPRVTTAEDELKQKVAALAGQHLKATTASLQHAEAQAKLRDKTATAAEMMKVLTERVHGQDGTFRDSSAGGLAKFHVALNDLEVTLGKVLLPQIDNVVTALAHWIDKIQRTGEAQRYAKDAVDLLKTAFGYLKDTIHFLDGVTGSFKNTVELLFGTWLGFKALRAVGSLIGTLGKLKAAFVAIQELGLVGSFAKYVFGIEAVGTASATATGEVAALSTGLGALAALGTIAIGVELVIAEKFTGKDPLGLSGHGGFWGSAKSFLEGNPGNSNWGALGSLFGLNGHGKNLHLGRGGAGGTAGSVGGFGHPAGRGGAFAPGAAGGFIPKGQGVTIGRADQGRDIQTGAGDPIIAPGDGYVVRIGHDPGGGGRHFGPAYPVVHFTTGPYAGDTIYIGHTTSALGAGARFRKGDVLAYTGHGGASAGGAPPGWAEIGFAPGGSPGPMGQATPFGGSSSPASPTLPPGLQTVSTLHSHHHRARHHHPAAPPLVPVSLTDAASRYANLASNLSNTGAKARTYLEDELGVLTREEHILEGKLKTAKGKHRDALEKALTGVENKITTVHRLIRDAVVASGDSLLPAGLLKRFKAASSKYAADSEWMKALTGTAAQAYAKIVHDDLTNQETILEAEVKSLKQRLTGGKSKQQSAIKAELAKITAQLSSVQQSIVSDLESTINTLQSQVSSVFSLVQQEILDQLGKQYFQNGALTPLEAKLQGMQAEDQLQGYLDAIDQAKKQLQTDLQGGLARQVFDAATGIITNIYDPAGLAQVAADQKSLAAAQRSYREYQLQIAATAERTKYDLAYARASQTLTKQLARLEQQFENGTGRMKDLVAIAQEFGVKITTSTIPDLASLASATHDLYTAFQDLTAYIGKVTGHTVKPGGAGSGVAAHTVSVASHVAVAGHGLAVGMAAGGAGRVTKPTLFLAGEAGAEDVAFSGGNKHFASRGGGGDVYVTVNVAGSVTAEKDLADAIRAQLVRQGRRVGPANLFS